MYSYTHFINKKEENSHSASLSASRRSVEFAWRSASASRTRDPEPRPPLHVDQSKKPQRPPPPPQPPWNHALKRRRRGEEGGCRSSAMLFKNSHRGWPAANPPRSAQMPLLRGFASRSLIHAGLRGGGGVMSAPLPSQRTSQVSSPLYRSFPLWAHRAPRRAPWRPVELDRGLGEARCKRSSKWHPEF